MNNNQDNTYVIGTIDGGVNPNIAKTAFKNNQSVKINTTADSSSPYYEKKSSNVGIVFLVLFLVCSICGYFYVKNMSAISLYNQDDIINIYGENQQETTTTTNTQKEEITTTIINSNSSTNTLLSSSVTYKSITALKETGVTIPSSVSTNNANKDISSVISYTIPSIFKETTNNKTTQLEYYYNEDSSEYKTLNFSTCGLSVYLENNTKAAETLSEEYALMYETDLLKNTINNKEWFISSHWFGGTRAITSINNYVLNINMQYDDEQQVLCDNYLYSILNSITLK